VFNNISSLYLDYQYNLCNDNYLIWYLRFYFRCVWLSASIDRRRKKVQSAMRNLLMW